MTCGHEGSQGPTPHRRVGNGGQRSPGLSWSTGTRIQAWEQREKGLSSSGPTLGLITVTTESEKSNRIFRKKKVEVSEVRQLPPRRQEPNLSQKKESARQPRSSTTERPYLSEIPNSNGTQGAGDRPSTARSPKVKRVDFDTF